ncbi:MAG: Trm112 family protein [Candidatus Marinimicrobia bacterium]|nr:Trm112 family protein [Candidatus Neomarinimicrobiota bacterium]MBT3633642.1 Trm112 family protein [Candidatus Neomarinimicrobiota bacterium]MBT3682405.1 Trm112 family protein [Candidatus Neomarinimicrobiota bacterium]MBT3759169.1 Trm112 family protein [Candidatus Neomarinimicrobiota bacterium]MBT3895558.1 Trm112 family protein [Candidatus Neomarinimicrobiota bacterium]
MEELLEIICCPYCKHDLSYETTSNLICHNCNQRYLIQDEIPVLLTK